MEIFHFTKKKMLSQAYYSRERQIGRNYPTSVPKYRLTPWSGVLQKLTVSQLVKEILWTHKSPPPVPILIQINPDMSPIPLSKDPS